MVLKGEVGFHKVVSVVESALKSKTKTEKNDAIETKRTIIKKLQNQTFSNRVECCVLLVTCDSNVHIWESQSN